MSVGLIPVSMVTVKMALTGTRVDVSQGGQEFIVNQVTNIRKSCTSQYH